MVNIPRTEHNNIIYHLPHTINKTGLNARSRNIRYLPSFSWPTVATLTFRQSLKSFEMMINGYWTHNIHNTRLTGMPYNVHKK
jgi:hypothetical protein